jgi:hypothetical protein
MGRRRWYVREGSCQKRHRLQLALFPLSEKGNKKGDFSRKGTDSFFAAAMMPGV